MQRESVEMGSGPDDHKSFAAHERDFLAHLEASCPEVDAEVVWVSPSVEPIDHEGVDDVPGDLDVADRDFLSALDATCRQSARLAQTGRTLYVLADVVAGGAMAALVATATFLARHDNDPTRPLALIAGAALVLAVLLFAAGGSVVTVAGYVDLRVQAMERRWIESDD